MPADDRLANLFEPVKLALARSAVPAQLRAGWQALLSLLPASWRDRIEGDERHLGLMPGRDELVLVAAGRRGDTVLGSLPLDDALLLADVHARLERNHTPRWLLLPESLVLRRRLSLPVAAEARLRDVLAFELDRQTPFSAEQVSYEGRVLSRDPAGQLVNVELLVLPRARLEAALSPLGPLGTGLAGVDVVEADGRRLGVNLLPEAHREARVDPVRRLNLILAGVAAVCLVGTLVLTLHNRGERLAELRRDVAAANDQARQARLVRNQLQVSAQAANFLATSRANRPTMLELLDDLTRRIPDDTSLDKLTVNDNRLVMVGQSRAAPALVGLLQASPLLAEPALAGAVQADPRSGRDRFTLTANIVEQLPAEAANAPRP
jgi:general secretion pathway protein L